MTIAKVLSAMCLDESGQQTAADEAVQQRKRIRRFRGSCIRCGDSVRVIRSFTRYGFFVPAHFQHLEALPCPLSNPGIRP
jgi:hypothetical protein